MKDFNDVLAFHQRFNLPCGEVPTPMSEDKLSFRLTFLREEADEFNHSWQEENLVGAVDALLDFVYVVYGTALFIGSKRQTFSFGLREWPWFEDAAGSADAFELRSEAAPHLLTPVLQAFAHRSLVTRVDMFELAHTAALNGEHCAINVALHMLRQSAVSAYSIAALMNIPWSRCWHHVQSANMDKQKAKVDGSDSKRASPWDVIKPVGWVAPDARIAVELQTAGWYAPCSPDKVLIINHDTGKVSMKSN